MQPCCVIEVNYGSTVHIASSFQKQKKRLAIAHLLYFNPRFLSKTFVCPNCQAMNHYRDINKQLVEQVQTMRGEIKLYSDEIVYLKRKLLQEHETVVFLKKQSCNWAVKSLAQFIQFVQPDSEILDILENFINTDERVFSTGTSHYCPTRSDARRRHSRQRSSSLAREFRRSSSVINLRKSVSSPSPIRTTSNNEASDEEEEQNSLPISNDNMEEVENAADADTDAGQSDIPRIADNDIIFEESYEEEEIEDVESVYESVEEVPINIVAQRATLNDITNTLKSTNISSKNNYKTQEKNLNKRGPPKRTEKKLRGKESFSDECTTSMEDSDYENTKEQKKRGPRRCAEITNKSFEETLQEPRSNCNSRRNLDTNRSFPLNQNHGQISNNEVTVNSTTLILNDMTLRNFEDAACSTPNSRKNSAAAPTTTLSETVSTIQTSSYTLSRPSRQCKPKNLTELSLTTKLRNESEVKPKRSGRTKSKRKTKI